MSDILHTQMIIFLFLPVAFGDYTCICNYNVEKTVYSEKSDQGQPVGYMYEFDCKAQVGSQDGDWFSIAFEHQIGYIYKDAQTTVQLCPGSPPTDDIVTTTMAPVKTTLLLTTDTTKLPGTSSSIKTTTQTFSAFTESSTSTRQSTKIPTRTRPASSVTTSPIDESTTTVTASSTIALPKISSTTSANPTSTTLSHSTLSSLTKETSITPLTTLELSSRNSVPSYQTTTVLPAATISTEGTTLKAIPTTQKMLSCQDLLKDIIKQDNSTIFAYGEKCFELIGIPTTWVNAELECRRKGGHLTDIANSIEQRIVYQVVNMYYHDSVWIGLHDIHHEENFEWTTGIPVVYTYWYPGRKDPDHHFTEDCVAMGMDKYAGQWEDRPCSESRGFVCQFGKHRLHAPVLIG